MLRVPSTKIMQLLATPAKARIMITFPCRHCGASNKVKNAEANKQSSCSSCGGTITAPPRPPSSSKSRANQKVAVGAVSSEQPLKQKLNFELRPKFEADLEDLLILFEEMLVIFWRVNPIGLAAQGFLDLFEQFRTQPTLAQQVELTIAAIDEVELIEPDSFSREFGEVIGETCEEFFRETQKSFLTQCPEGEPLLRSFCDHDVASFREDFSAMVARAIARQDGHYQTLYHHYLQIKEFQPRYVQVMSRSGFFDIAVSLVAGWFGGGFGFKGAEIWNNWRNADDNEFCQKFMAALEDFQIACANFSADGERALAIIFERLIGEFRLVSHQVIDAIATLESSGWDIAPIYQEWRKFEEPEDDNSKRLILWALENLENNRSINYSTLRNLNEITQINSWSPIREPSLLETQHSEQVIDAQLAENEDLQPLAHDLEINCESSEALNDRPIVGCLTDEAQVLNFVQETATTFDYDTAYVFVAPEIPAKKIKNALASYAYEIKPNLALMLFDHTVFGSAKRGLLITQEQIAWKNDDNVARKLNVNEINSVATKHSNSIFSYSSVVVNGQEIEVGGGDAKTRNQTVDLIGKVLETLSDLND